MPLRVRPRRGTSRTLLGALQAAAAALQAGVGAAIPSGFVHHGRVPATRDGGQRRGVHQQPACSQAPEWQGQVTVAAFPRRGREGEKAPPGWRLAQRSPDSGYDSPLPHTNRSLRPSGPRIRIRSGSYLMEGGTENLPRPASRARIPREGQQCPARGTWGFGGSISASGASDWAANRKLPRRVFPSGAEQ